MDADLAAYLDRVRAHRGELGESMLALDVALAIPIRMRERWRDRVEAALAELRHDLDDHVALTESPKGLYADVRARAPRLDSAVQQLLDEHVHFLEKADELLEVVQSPDWQDDIPDLRETITDLVGRLVRHRQKGSDLIYEAYEVDIGGSG